MLFCLKKFMARYPGEVILLTFVLFLSNVFEALGISVIIPVFQQLLDEKNPDSRIYMTIEKFYNFFSVPIGLGSILIGLSILFVFRAALTVFAKKISVSISTKYLHELQMSLFNSLFRVRLSFFLGEKQGVLTNAMTSEITRAAYSFVQFNLWMSSVLTAGIYILIALFVSGKLAIISTIAGICALAPLKFVTRKTSEVGSSYTVVNEDMQTHLNESFSGFKFIKAGAFQEKVALHIKKFSSRHSQNWGEQAFISNLINVFSQPIAVFVLCGVLFAGKKLMLPVPELIVFLLVFQRLLPTISYAQAVRNDFEMNLPALLRIDEIERKAIANSERQDGEKIREFSTCISFEHISFSHSSNKSPENFLFKNLSLSINHPRMVTLLGPSGSGKSTLVDLILGFHNVDSGVITIDGKPLNQINLSSWRSLISYVSQETFLFHDTIFNNIAFENPEITKEQVVKAAKLAHAHDFIMSLENGYDSVVGHRGDQLSGGQKQRISLARALIKNPKVLILDEATSALDYESESLIKDTILKIKAQKETTIILIAHRLTTVKESDVIYILDKGHIVEKGNWSELTENEESFISKSLKHH